ncbi:hypothetical protein [Clostridium tunisiense]|nr:hypothetical protein [Clostridium tunisiense]
MDQQIKDARNKYMREWRAKNKDKVKAAQERYWKRKAKLELNN